MSSNTNPIPPILDLTIEDILHGFDTGSFSSYDLVSTYLARIEQINGVLNAIAEVNPDAIEIALERDREREEGRLRGSLHGVPILYKDAFFTDDPMQNTVGSTALRDRKMDNETVVISKLKDAGAIMPGTTTLTEWCNLRTKNSPHGWSAVWGQRHGAYYPNQDPTGSSSGSAVAVSVGLSPAALGKETWGSITLPSQKNAVVGIKPTPGLVSQQGIFVLNQYQDAAGPIARTVKDAARILQVIAGPGHGQDGNERSIEEDYVAAATASRLDGIKIVSPSHIITQDREVVSRYEKSLEELRDLGATVLKDICPSRFGANQTPEEKVDEYGITEFEAANQSVYTEDSEEFIASLEKRNQFGKEIEMLLDSTESDAIIVPGSGDTPSDMGGNPAVLVPLGFYTKNHPISSIKDNMPYKGPKIPFGLMFIGRRYGEAKLIKIAASWEAASATRDLVRHYITSNIEIEPESHGHSLKL